VEVDARGQPGELLEQRPDDLVGGARIGRRLEHDQHARPQVATDRLGRAGHRPQVRPVALGEWRRHADHRGAGARDQPLVGGGAEAAGEHVDDVGVAEVVHVRPAGTERRDHLRVDIEAEHPQPGPGGLLGERQADVPQPQDDNVISHEISPS